LDGLLNTIIAPDGTLTEWTFHQAGADANGFSLTRADITRNYNAEGELETLLLSDDTVLTLGAGGVEVLELADGTTITDGVFDPEDQGRLISGLVALTDGRQVTYQNSEPTEALLSDETRITYSNGSPSSLLLPDDLEYTLTHDANTLHWLADLVREPTVGEPLIQMIYSDDWVLDV
jgi:hypothetical protein